MNGAVTSLKLLALILLITLSIGCEHDDDEGPSQVNQVFTEHHFGENPDFRADPENHLIVKFLEHPDHDEHENDTGGIGHDVIPHTYERTVDHTFCWEDEDPDAEHFMVIEDSEGNEILRLFVGDCVTETIFEGYYDMVIHHDGIIDRNHPIFIRHGHDEDLMATINNKPPTMLEITMGVFYKMLDRLDIDIIKTTYAQTEQNNINTLITTNACSGCDLYSANLSQANLTSANLSQANLTRVVLTDANLLSADLRDADFSGALWVDGVTRCKSPSIGICIPLTLEDYIEMLLTTGFCGACPLSGADLSGENLEGAILHGADLRGADLSGANLSNADLSLSFLNNANMSGVDLSNSDLSEALLDNADLSGANLSNADLSGASMFQTNLRGADLTGANLTGASAARVGLIEADLSGAVLDNANLSDSVLQDANLTGAGMVEVDLMRANLSRAILDNANLTVARMEFSNLSFASIVGTIFTGAVLDNAIWVDGVTLCGQPSIGMCVAFEFP